MVVPIEYDGDEIRPGAPQVLFSGNYPPIDLNRLYAVAPDGRFAMRVLDPTLDRSPYRYSVILDWLQED